MTMLQSTLIVGPLAPGATVTMLHHITDVGTVGKPLTPKQVMPVRPTPIAVLGLPTNTSITFGNNGTVPDTCAFECVCPHSMQEDRDDTTSCYWRGVNPSIPMGVATNIKLGADPAGAPVTYTQQHGEQLATSGHGARPLVQLGSVRDRHHQG